MYAPITRDGMPLDKKGNKYEVQPEALSSFAALNELHRTLPAKVFESRVSVDVVKHKFKAGLTRKEVSHKQELVLAEATIKKSNEAKEEKE